MKQTKISIDSLSVGMLCTKPIVNKKNEILLPEFHSIHPIYLSEWIGEVLYTDGELQQKDPSSEVVNEQKQRLSFELPSYIDKETRMLLQRYYDDVRLLKGLCENLKQINLNTVQNLTSFWASYALKKDNVSTLLAVCRHALFEEDEYFYIHTMDVVLISLGIYVHYYKNPRALELSQLAAGALFFDIGMLLLPRELKRAGGTFYGDQKVEIQKHTLLGYSFMTKSEMPNIYALPSLEHHERLDGSGYPRGLKGEDIHPNSIIISLADVFTSQIRTRSFKEGREPAEILKDFIQTMMPVFPKNYSLYIAAFVSFMTIYPTTSIVKLNTGDIAIVLQTNVENPTKPTVLLLLDQDMNKYTTNIKIDLSEDFHTIIGTYTRAMLIELGSSL